MLSQGSVGNHRKPSRMPKGYTTLPNVLLYDDRVPAAVKLTWVWLFHLAWRFRPDRNAKGIVGLPVHLPPMDVIAARVGITPRSLIRHLDLLRELGYVRTERPSRRDALVYRIYAHPKPAEQADPDTTDVAAIGDASTDTAVSTPEALYARAPSGKELEEKQPSNEGALRAGIDWELAGDPPPLARDMNGHATALEALAEVSGILPASPRYSEAAAALHGRRTNLDSQPGINRLYWLSVAVTHDLSLREVRARAEANPGRYHAALAAEVRRKAALYRQRLPGATLTPTALARWWTDLDGPAPPMGRGLSAAEIEALS